MLEGDKLDCLVDLGFGLVGTFRFRLAGINTPELSGSDGQAALEFTKEWLNDRALLVRTTGDPEQGCWLAEFVDAGSKEHLSTALIDAGYGS